MQYLILMSGDIFINESLMYKGIYAATSPKLYPIGTTREDIYDRHQTFANVKFGAKEHDSYMSAVIANLSKCELKLFKLEAVKAS